MTRFINRVFPVFVQVAPPVPSVDEMRQFLQKHDPYFATDAYLSQLDEVTLVGYYRDVMDALEPAYRDDWDERLINVKANNL